MILQRGKCYKINKDNTYFSPLGNMLLVTWDERALVVSTRWATTGDRLSGNLNGLG